MQTLPLDFAADDTSAGFRLQRLEVLNWGTFHQHVWAIDPHGHNTLLTGDIGSGKSTLVDAVTTLLVPHDRITYNKAAGAEGKERSLYSYIRGEYKSEKDDATQSAKAVALRDDNSYTVLLGYFYNAGFNQGITLAQVFWLKDQKRNPERFFVVARKPLTIAEYFSNFGNDILDLKKRLRRQEQVEVFDKFKEYSSLFRHLFGNLKEQALMLFFQTVSMKSVGNLTDFVRLHMLEGGNVENRIEELCKNFDNLNQAHEAVLKAKRQIEQLFPLVTDGEKYQLLCASVEELRHCRDTLFAYFAHHKTELLTADITRLTTDIQKNTARLDQVKEELHQLRQQAISLSAAIEQSGGGRLRDIEQEIGKLTGIREEKRIKEKEYNGCVAKLDLRSVRSEGEFYSNRNEAEGLFQRLEAQIEEANRAVVDQEIERKNLNGERSEIRNEIDSLRQRKSNIPFKNLEIRREMAEILKIKAEELPFVGELLQVDESESPWRGAIERVLHNFGLSLLVPETLYAQVSHYVERTHLQDRLVYFRVREADIRGKVRNTEPNSLLRKLRIKPDTPVYAWLEAQLAERFDYICCDDLETFRRLPKAITLKGQIKSGGQRHEKDDRRRIDDSSTYVLGWSNADKIKALEAKKAALERQVAKIAERLAILDREQKTLVEKRDVARDLLKFRNYGEIHWELVAGQIQALEEEKREIEQSSDRLRTLRDQFALVQEQLLIKEDRQSGLNEESGKLKGSLKDRQGELEEASKLAGLLTDSEKLVWFPKLDSMKTDALAETPFTLKNLEKSERGMRDHLQGRMDNDNKKIKLLSEKILGQMGAYKSAFPAETVEVDAALDSLYEYAAMLKSLQGQDLPRHEARFKQLLNEGTINSIALFQNQLDKERQQITEKIDTINISLKQIDYNPGTYIEMVKDKTIDPEIRDFQQELKQCLANTLADSDVYNETKFLQVKAIIDRFNGREGFVPQDRDWTRKVTDVRYWFSFSASERWKEDGSEKEFYPGSSGKSGGQKEKLAYTILASALAYQFGLEWGATQSRSFRFAVIDEAFGRGSDESTRYGLELFKKLNLQLLIVTPLQKIHIIEDYVRSVHYVHNEGGCDSVIRNLTLEEYKAEKELYLKQAQT